MLLHLYRDYSRFLLVSSDQVLNLLFLDGSHWYYKTINLLQLG
jgi:hypothetical protein